MSDWVDVRDVVVSYGSGRSARRAVDGVSLRIAKGEAVGLVGESGCGKSSLGRALLGLEPLAGGTVRIGGQDLVEALNHDARAFRRRAQMVFQDPYGSLNPRMTVGRAVEEALVAHGWDDADQRAARVAGLFASVGLDPSVARRYPHEFSGGQRQRIGLARALAVEPSFLVADEPVSALDVSVQAQVMNLLRDLQRELGLTCLFVAHDLAVVRYLCTRVYVMYRGRIVEEGPASAVFERPAHPYTALLLESVTDVRRGLDRSAVGRRLVSDEPHRTVGGGCVFSDRCPMAVGVCRSAVPPLATVGEGRASACLRSADVLEGGVVAR